jgi:hypothetical protein
MSYRWRKEVPFLPDLLQLQTRGCWFHTVQSEGKITIHTPYVSQQVTIGILHQLQRLQVPSQKFPSHESE